MRAIFNVHEGRRFPTPAAANVSFQSFAKKAKWVLGNDCKRFYSFTFETIVSILHFMEVAPVVLLSFLSAAKA